MPAIGATVLGYPRIGPHRELKKALEGYWAGAVSRHDLEHTAATLRRQSVRRMAELGLDTVPSNTFSLYDHVLDAAVLVGAVPQRFTSFEDELDRYFAMARGAASRRTRNEGGDERDQPDGDVGDVAPLEMTKWFDTNYHYLVPEIGPATPFQLNAAKLVAEYREALAEGVVTRPVTIGPASLLLLAKPDDEAPAGFRPFDRLDELTSIYAELLETLADAGVPWIQLDEPSFVADRDAAEITALQRVYQRLATLERRPAIFVASYFGDLGDALPALAMTPVEAIGVDLVAGSGAGRVAATPNLAGKTVVAGVVDGRNVWRADLESALGSLATLLGLAGDVAVSTSCSLLHVPYDLDAEPDIDSRLRSWLAFADQKVTEVVTLARGLHEGYDAVAGRIQEGTSARDDRATASSVVDPAVRQRIADLPPEASQRSPYAHRIAVQADNLDLPPLPTTTIGSFPQTGDVRSVRAAYRNGQIDADEYSSRMRTEIERIIRLQERLGLDVLVHGEPERNDMVQYFAELLNGFITTRNGWVQSYGSRCVRPPIVYGDVSRPAPMTVEWASYAQGLTDRPVKGMLTGPVTMLAWSFVRDDQPLADTARQVALAIRDETRDLEAEGIRIIQVDEPAIRELLPLRASEQPEYLRWAVDAFRLATSGVADTTQIHTHMCYSEFGEVMSAIDGLEADVTSIEAARSKMEILPELAASGFARGIGPGVYDIHSPRVPSNDEIATLLLRASQAVPATRLWVNPDCGLKTRSYAEVEPALAAMVTAVRQVREAL
ncbi:5-methyltetrahydropteroyltriglutamate--homocysteine S-methyltransferase [Actinobacteria bacterium YIM 96077]|uniref:5-methyltetrahydropteroyltriglutamate--homocysteine methyltransferase n=1 Tax=Phytoactinopolyspora halophila TaxID=1981511 RepID=A0A329R4T2_9ACTN|nr:5-methyltetrahydropteroyltriglutamate--homocysteine S-methyltransferase [Actinobacteria bacterium YIM 96077]RAW18926.1 5-methyltetrahydropteroyltriglutamate--homocysteine S-methyltransferase [Phytoactinopolyspora halophila]